MRRTLFITAAVPLLVLVGGGGAVASAAPTAPTLAPMTDPSDDPEERIRQFVRCLQDNGIDMPDPEAHGPVHFEIGPDGREEFDDALQACEALAPPHGPAMGLGPEQREEIEEFHECLSDHGVDLPEPGGIAVSRSVEAGRSAGPVLHEDGPPHGETHHLTPLPGSEEAVEACKDLLPGDGPIIVGSAAGDEVFGEARPAGGIGISLVGGEG
jgi:hypothetical protein